MPGDMQYAMINGPNGSIGGLVPTNPEGPVVGTTNYITVANLEACMETVTSNGGNVIVPIQEVPTMGRFFWFTSPGGVVLACWQDL
jgi:predicted enzyme related to lactoylglutathione lyase